MRRLTRIFRNRKRPAGLLTGLRGQRAKTAADQVHARAAWAGRGRVPLPLWWVYQAYLYFVWRYRTLPAIPGEAWPDDSAAQTYGKGWCLTPTDLALAQQCGADDPLDCVFPVETKGVHALLNQGRVGAPGALKLLHDKQAAANHMAAHDIAIMPTVCAADAAAAIPLDRLVADHDALFVKGRVSARGQGALKIWRDQAGIIQGLRFGGGVIEGQEAVMQAIDDLARLGPFLVQPYAAPHPDLAPLCARDEVPTVRTITVERQDGTIDILLATLEVPRRADGDAARTQYRFLTIDPETGAFSYRLNADGPIVADLPHWDQVAAGSVWAHQVTRGPWAIAWDWVVTAEGAFLLEGNGGFALGELQRQKGPLLRDGAALSPALDQLLNH